MSSVLNENLFALVKGNDGYSLYQCNATLGSSVTSVFSSNVVVPDGRKLQVGDMLIDGNGARASIDAISYDKTILTVSFMGYTAFDPNAVYSGLTAGKAIADEEGNNIPDTYSTKTYVDDYVDDKVSDKYTKPSSGIPETDLEESVQEKLNAPSGGIVFVEELPEVTKAEYDKHFIYLQGEDLHYIALIDLENPVTVECDSCLDSRRGPCAAVVDKTIYIFGGGGLLITSSDVKTIEKHDTVSNTTTKIATQLNSNVQNGSAIGYGTDIYIFGGNNSKQILKFDTLTETVSTMGQLPAVCAAGGVATYDKYIFVFSYGGVYRYDVENNTSASTGTGFESNRNQFGLAQLGERAYLFGGYAYSGGSHYYKTIKYFDMSALTWTTLETELPSNLTQFSATFVEENCYLFGGRAGSSSTSTTDAILKFNSETEEVTTLTATLPEVLQNTAAVTVGYDAFCICGVGETYASNDITKLQIKDYGYKTIATK